MTTIVEFLTARLDEDQAAAEAASHHVLREKWHAVEWYDGEFVANGRRTAHVDIHGLAGTPITFRGALRREDGEHIARHDPARVLREVEAKRATVALHRIDTYPERWGDVRWPPEADTPAARDRAYGELTGGTLYSCVTCDGFHSDGDPSVRAQVACETIMHMASVYADHQDYDPAWRISAT